VKKLVIISLIFSVVLGFSVWEMCFSVKVYNSILDDLYAVEKMVGDAPDNVDSEAILEKIDSVLSTWKRAKERLFCLGNHTILRLVDEKLVFMSATFKNNDTAAAPASLKSAISLVKAISNDAVPVITNLF